MKKISFLLAVILAFNKLAAGDREWAVVGKVLTGVAVVSVAQRAIEPQPVVVYQQPIIAQPQPIVVKPVIMQPTPVVYYAPVIVYRPFPVYRYHYVRY